MEAVIEKQPANIHLLRPLITKQLDTLKLSRFWPKDAAFFREENISKFRDSAVQLLRLAAAQQSVHISDEPFVLFLHLTIFYAFLFVSFAPASKTFRTRWIENMPPQFAGGSTSLILTKAT